MRPPIKETGSDLEWVMNVMEANLNPPAQETTTRSRWAVDENIPIFSTPEGRTYIERFVYPKAAQPGSGLDESV